MNDCLLAKWIWKIHFTDNELWFRIIKAKYFPMGAFRDAKVLNGSQFWKSIQKVNCLFFKGTTFQAGDGCNVSFWEMFGWVIAP